MLVDVDTEVVVDVDVEVIVDDVVLVDDLLLNLEWRVVVESFRGPSWTV